ncbi:MAG: T9SS type A sorting domain-containing protein [Hymenobacter sp.]|nr:T9SS type A sorting domain-containing protein [Hymenobacter sp.]
MKKILLALFLLAHGQDLLAQLPTNSFAVTAACPASAGNTSVLQGINTDGSLTPVAPIIDAGTGTRLIINALGFDSNPLNQTGIYGMSVVQPITINNFDTPPTFYRIDLGTAQATSLGAVTPPPTPTSGLSSPGPTEILIRDVRQTFNFIGDGGSNSEYYASGATARIFSSGGLSGPFRVADLRLYVGVIQLTPFSTASPVWRQLDASDPATTALIAGYQDEVQAYLNSNGTLPIPQGGLQDWVYDVRTGNLVSYLGQDDQFLTIRNPATNPAAVTTQPTDTIPTQQDIGSMFTDRNGNVYAVDADGGTIYRIDRLTGNYSNVSFGTAFGCSRGDAVSMPGALPLPVTLTRFSATPQCGAVRLDWATASEKNAATFLVQRSRSGTDWQTVQTVRAGNRPTGQAYSALDAAPLAGQSYYRLSQRDLDGTTAYSPVQAVLMPGLTGKAIAEVYPNPTAEGRFTVLLPQQAEGPGTALELLNATGQSVRRARAEAGQRTLPLDVHGLPAGLYYLRVRQSGLSSTVSVVLLPDESR